MSKLVLIIDDEIDIREALGFFFERKGIKVLTAENGLNALEILQKAPLRPDLILLDGNMPKMTGQEFLAHRKSHNVYPDIPVILLSSTLWDVEDNSIVSSFPKPFDLNRLFIEVESALRSFSPDP